MQTIHNELENVLQLVYIVGAKLFCVCWEPLYVLIPKLTSVVLLVVCIILWNVSVNCLYTHENTVWVTANAYIYSQAQQVRLAFFTSLLL